MLNITVRGHDLSGVASVKDLAEHTKKQGVHNLQLALGMSFPDMPSGAANLNPGMGAAIKRELANEDVQVGILSCYINMIHPDLEIREQLLQKFESYLRHARYFGASMVASETGCVLPEIQYTEDNFSDEAFADMVGVIRRLVKAGEEAGMLVGIEPGLNHPLYSLERVEQLLTAVQSDYLGIIFDPSNLITNEDYQHQVAMVERAFERFGDKIVAVHLKDFKVEDDQIIPVNLGEGLIDYAAIARIIAKHKPLSYVVLEETKDDHIGRALQLSLASEAKP
ncbi:sugar phosphate isomerase/epimerase family protein [Trichococcus shcherbakoviae]|uniref:Sugar phosphate isomerase/epimerase n=1 Tax=Trichococcus shcherbakoviae subsp. psychrophilus TaxID=2585775 RepID=A0A5C5EAS8_9LACT|nr:sugar phosphate isomerase/epimerase family protein [Trichococcus shcherbakoviae]TNV69713.1 sugar phosphate isomerase/epimerase [Trichococcus shcherbakoviae subsp. psychrophilus]